MESIGFKEWSSAAIPWALGFVLDAATATLHAKGATVRREELGKVKPNRRQPHPECRGTDFRRPVS